LVAKVNARLFDRWRRLEGSRRTLLIRAGWWLSIASAAVALLPFNRAIRIGCVDLRTPPPSSSADEVVWAIEAASRYLPWRTMCIEQGLAAQRMLRTGGIAAVLHYGVRQHPDIATIEAHVWVCVSGRIVLGAEQAGKFAQVAVYP
jgi:hypothetical protein